MTSLGKFAAGALALIILVWVGYCGIQKAARDAVLSTIKRDTLTRQVVRTDSVYRTDTVNLRVARTRYDTLRRRVVITDTVSVRKVLEAADSTIKACTEVVSSCAATIKARDALIEELRKPPYVPRLRYTLEGLYDPLNRIAVLRGGPDVRLFGTLSIIAEAELSQPASTTTEPGMKGRLRVGFRKVF